MQPHGRQPLFQHPLQLPDQACGHGCAPILDGVAARNANLDPTTTHLGNFTKSLGRSLRRRAWHNWMSSSLYGPGGDPVETRLGCKSPLLEHFALGGGKAKQLELAHAIHNVDMQTRACRDKLSKRKGVKQEDPRGELNNSFHNNKEQQTTTAKQLDQARLLEGQLRIDLEKKKLQLKELQQKERTKTSNNNNLGTSSLSNISNNDLGANSLEEQTLGENSLGREDQQYIESLEPETLAPRSANKLWQILIDTGAEISVAPRSFAAEVQLSNLGRTDLQLRSAEGKAINIFGWRTVQLLTQNFSFCITFAIADVETPLLGLGSLLASNLSLHIDKNLGHHLSNSLGERIQLEQRGLQLYLAACPTKLGFNLSNQGILLDNISLMPEAKLGTKQLAA